jgi:fructose-1,6-bisphosphatase/sedoheptulose 1,7-bisphosphatase-like protein
MRKTLTAAIAALSLLGLGACSSAADTASQNLSQQADDFKITRRVVLYNGITNTYVLAVVGKCSLGNDDTGNETTVTCMMPDGSYVKNIFRTGNNMTVFAQQLVGTDVSTQRYEVFFKPEQSIPDIRLR